MQTNSEWLPEWYTTDDAVYKLFTRVDDQLLDGDFAQVDDLILTVDLEQLDTTRIVALLSITAAARHKLIHRADFVTRVEQRLLVLAPDRIDGLMKGLR